MARDSTVCRGSRHPRMRGVAGCRWILSPPRQLHVLSQSCRTGKRGLQSCASTVARARASWIVHQASSGSREDSISIDEVTLAIESSSCLWWLSLIRLRNGEPRQRLQPWNFRVTVPTYSTNLLQCCRRDTCDNTRWLSHGQGLLTRRHMFNASVVIGWLPA